MSRSLFQMRTCDSRDLVRFYSIRDGNGSITGNSSYRRMRRRQRYLNKNWKTSDRDRVSRVADTSRSRSLEWPRNFGRTEPVARVSKCLCYNIIYYRPIYCSLIYNNNRYKIPVLLFNRINCTRNVFLDTKQPSIAHTHTV